MFFDNINASPIAMLSSEFSAQLHQMLAECRARKVTRSFSAALSHLRRLSPPK
jgi:hypothetical protein